MKIKISSYFQVQSNITYENTKRFLISNKEIKFFYQPLLDKENQGRSEFYFINSPDPEITISLFRFFLGYREIDILVLSIAIDYAFKEIKEDLDILYKKLWKTALKLCKNKENFKELRRYSCLVEAVEQNYLNDFAKVFLGNRNLEPIDKQLTTTEKGFLYTIIETYHYAQYERYLVMYSLLLAYQITFEIFINELSSYATGKNIELLGDLRKECAQFNAIFYFNNPIKPGNSNLLPAWNDLAIPFNMEDLNKELLDQLEAIAQIYQIEREFILKEKERQEALERLRHEKELKIKAEKEQRRERNLNYLLSFFGILLAGLAVIEITPSELNNFFQEWGLLIQSWFGPSCD